MQQVQPIALILCLAASFGPAAWADTALLPKATGLAGVAMWLPRAKRRRSIGSLTRGGGAPGMALVVVRGPESLVQDYGETTMGNADDMEALIAYLRSLPAVE